MAIKIVCDRCGREGNPSSVSNLPLDWEHVAIVQEIVRDGEMLLTAKFGLKDLCKKCTAEFRSFMNPPRQG